MVSTVNLHPYSPGAEAGSGEGARGGGRGEGEGESEGEGEGGSGEGEVELVDVRVLGTRGEDPKKPTPRALADDMVRAVQARTLTWKHHPVSKF